MRGRIAASREGRYRPRNFTRAGRKRLRSASLALWFATLLALTATPAVLAVEAPEIVWTRQFGTSSDDFAYGISVDPSGLYVAGDTLGTLPGQTSAGGTDAYVRKTDIDGNEVWTRQFGSSTFDGAVEIAVEASRVYVLGTTDGTLPGQTSAGGTDIFVRTYDIDGNEVWTRQFGSSTLDFPHGVSVDPSGVYVAGMTSGSLPNQTYAGRDDAFVRKYDADGNEVWTRQFGSTAFDGARGVAVDAPGVYVAGMTSGILPGQMNFGVVDVFVRMYDVNGIEAWTRQFGSSTFDEPLGIAVDPSGVYVAGFTDGTLPGQTSAGSGDAFVGKLAMRPALPPSAPQSLQATPGDGQVDLNWSAPLEDGGFPITDYNVYRGTSSGSETLLATVAGVLNHTDVSVTNGVTYYYQISAVNVVGEGPKSSESLATPTAPPGDGPTGGAVPPEVLLLVAALAGVALAAAVILVLLRRRRGPGKTGEGPEKL